MYFPSGTTLPILVPIYFSIGKWPVVITSVVNPGGSTTPNPLLVPTFERDSEDYVTNLTLNPAPDTAGVTDVDLIVNIYPQDIY